MARISNQTVFLSRTILDWNRVYYHFNKWSKADCWKQIWLSVLEAHRSYLDLSSIELDGSHTPAKNGGEAFGYQGRKGCKTSNALFISDSQGVLLAMSTPQEGQHHDLFEIQTLFEELSTILKEAKIDLEDLFLNADPGFDSENFTKACEKETIFPNVKPNPRNKSRNEDREPYQSGTHIFDDQLYKRRTVIEHSNAWLDGFKALLVRFEFKKHNGVALHFIAFMIIFLRKSKKLKKV